MNERIRLLAEKARKYARDYVADCKHYGYYMEHNEYELRFEEKFTELIVRECARVYWNIDNGETHTEYVEALKQHFGVEE